MLLLRQVGVVSARHDRKDPSSPLALLVADAPSLLKASARQLSDKSLKTRIGMFGVLHTLVGVLPSSVADHVGLLVPGEGGGGLCFSLFGVAFFSFCGGGGLLCLVAVTSGLYWGFLWDGGGGFAGGGGNGGLGSCCAMLSGCSLFWVQNGEVSGVFVAVFVVVLEGTHTAWCAGTPCAGWFMQLLPRLVAVYVCRASVGRSKQHRHTFTATKHDGICMAHPAQGLLADPSQRVWGGVTRAA